MQISAEQCADECMAKGAVIISISKYVIVMMIHKKIILAKSSNKTESGLRVRNFSRSLQKLEHIM